MTDREDVQPGWLISRWTFLRVLGLVYLFAFWSLWDQALGVLGENGLAPARLALQGHRAEYGWLAMWHAPSVFWIGHGDGFIQMIMGVGLIASLLMVVNLAPRSVAIVLWILSLSVSSLRGPLSPNLFFEWAPDQLLLEVGFLALFLAPSGWRPGLAAKTPPANWVRWLLYFALFKVMFGSGMLKLLHGQDIWLDLTALYYDHETRPSPTALAAYAWDLPIWTHQACALFTLLVEIPVTLLYFVKGRPRRIAAVLTAVLMIGISLAGNYRWFPLTTMALVALLVDDAIWQRLRLFRSPGLRVPVPSLQAPGILRRSATAILVGVLLTIGSIQTLDICNGRPEPIELLRGLRQSLAQFHLSHGYAMFPHIQTERRVIQFEASDDGVRWTPIENFSNPGPGDRSCHYFAPYHYYLDFLMWMSAYAKWDDNPAWVAHLAHGVLTGNAPTYQLFRRVPWQPADPPRFFRGTAYVYKYATPTERTAGTWWTRTRIGPWLPAATLDENGHLTPAQF